jgi:uncharacterized protein YndB with AHSA1/START domain
MSEASGPGYGKQPCTVLEADPPHRFVYTCTAAWPSPGAWRPRNRNAGVIGAQRL